MSTQTLTAPARARSTTVAAKIGMAISGLFFVLFVIAHMYGNLNMFAGPEAYNSYAHHLRVLGEPYLPYEGGLWILRVLLLVALAVHVWAALTLWGRANAARGSRYQVKNQQVKSYSPHVMRYGGIALLLFIVFHILQFTTLTIQVGGNYDALEPYGRMIAGFSQWWLWAIYLLAMIFLAMHVRQGTWSALATLGLNKERRTGLFQTIGTVIAVLVFLGFMAPPTAVLLGWIS